MPLTDEQLRELKTIVQRAVPFKNDILSNTPIRELDTIETEAQWMQALHNTNAFMVAITFMPQIIDELIALRSQQTP